MYERLPVLWRVLPGTFANMIEQNQIPPEVAWYHILPFAKAGKDPCMCGSKSPISLLNTFMKLLEMILVRRMTGIPEPRLVNY